MNLEEESANLITALSDYEKFKQDYEYSKSQHLNCIQLSAANLTSLNPKIIAVNNNIRRLEETVGRKRQTVQSIITDEHNCTDDMDKLTKRISKLMNEMTAIRQTIDRKQKAFNSINEAKENAKRQRIAVRLEIDDFLCDLQKARQMS